MSKKIYSLELKLEIINRYLEGNISIQKLAKEYHICSNACIQKWLALYQEHGEDGLTKIHGTYSGDFKVSVVEYKQITGASLQQTAARFHIPSKTSVGKWEQIYQELGKEALYQERRGRANRVRIEQQEKEKKNRNEKEDLLAEVQRLRMENDYLKKLNALIQKREKYEKQIK